MDKENKENELERLSPSEATPLLLSMARAQSAKRSPVDLMSQFDRDGFVAPSPLDQRLLHALDGLALDAASGFEALLLSPTAPLGVCSALAPTSQDRTVSAMRGLEVVSDPTNVLSLECAKRLRRDPTQTVRLCTLHQTLRAQALPAKKGHSRHFRLFALASAGPARESDGFEVSSIARHVSVMNSLFDALSSLDCVFPNRRATLFLSERRKTMGERIVKAIQTKLPHIEIKTEAFESRYYDGVRFLLGADSQEGHNIQLADTGVFDWVSKLTTNKKLRFVASGMGIQLAPMLFKKHPK